MQTKEFIEEFKTNYQNYAYYVITDRAIPAIEDGLKPVHRRILYAMYKLGLTHDKTLVKSAKVVGEVIGNYHPHGDKSVYDSLVRLGQSFITNHPLVEIQGNCGSIDDPSSFAAMRYTESRLSEFSSFYLDGLKRNAIDFTSTYDETDQEPTLLPCKIPVPCLVNGVQGIGVGIAASIPPHNLNELADAVLALLENPDLEILDLLNYVKGPDFPSKGTLLADHNLLTTYSTGRGSFVVRGKIDYVENKKDKYLQITELPYQVSPEEIIDSIMKLIISKKISGIDKPINSTQKTVNIMIPLKRDTNPALITNILYKYTRLQTSISMNLIALVNGKPRQLNLKDCVQSHIDFRRNIIRRETKFKLNEAEDRLHIINGFTTALSHLDSIISGIRSSESSETAKTFLMTNYNLSEIQASKILEMQLRRLAALEQEKIYTEQNQLKTLIKELENILEDAAKVDQILKDELLEIKQKFTKQRQTELDQTISSSIDLEAVTPNLPTTVMVTRMGYVKRIAVNAIKQQNKNTKGSKGIDILEADYLIDIFNCMAHDPVLIFTNKAKVYALKAYDIPEKGKNVKGTNLINLLPSLEPGELVSAVVPLSKENSKEYLLLVTKQGIACRVNRNSYDLKITRGVKAMKLREGDELLGVKGCRENDVVVFGSDSGLFCKVPVSEFSPRQSRTSSGLNAMTLKPGASIINFDVISEDDKSELVIITKLGVGKQINITEINNRHRRSVGQIFIKFKDSNDRVASFCIVREPHLIIVTSNGIMNKITLDDIKACKGTHSRGSSILKLNVGDYITSIANVLQNEIEEIE